MPKRKLTIDELRIIFASEGCELLSESYINSYHPLLYRCVCGEVSTTYLSNFRKGARCVECKKKKLRAAHSHDFEYVKKCFDERGFKLLSTSYKNNRDKLDYICVCGEKSKITLHDLLVGSKCRECHYRRMTGPNNPIWNHNKTLEERISDRSSQEYRSWVKAVFERDSYSCLCCEKQSSGDIEAHHKDGHNWCIDRRYDIDNGATLCIICHKEFHKIYGKRHVTEEQFHEFINNKRGDCNDPI